MIHWLPKGHPHQKCAYDPGAQPGQGEKQAVPVDTVVRAGEGWPLASAPTHPVWTTSLSYWVQLNLSTQAVILAPLAHGVRRIGLREPKQPARVDTAKQRKQCKLPTGLGSAVSPKSGLKLQPHPELCTGDRALQEVIRTQWGDEHRAWIRQGWCP